MSGEGGPSFFGDISPQEAFDLLSNEATATLVDVRTSAELAFVGAPDLTDIGKRLHHIEWSAFPTGELNTNFLRELEAVVRAAGSEHLLFLCRSGQRSRRAAQAAEELPIEKPLRLYNVATGFEGDLDSDGRRGRASGWKVAGLPWRQN